MVGERRHGPPSLVPDAGRAAGSSPRTGRKRSHSVTQVAWVLELASHEGREAPREAGHGHALLHREAFGDTDSGFQRLPPAPQEFAFTVHRVGDVVRPQGGGGRRRSPENTVVRPASPPSTRIRTYDAHDVLAHSQDEDPRNSPPSLASSWGNGQ